MQKEYINIDPPTLICATCNEGLWAEQKIIDHPWKIREKTTTFFIYTCIPCRELARLEGYEQGLKDAIKTVETGVN